MHFDGILCFMALAGAQEVELGAPMRIYHVDRLTIVAIQRQLARVGCVACPDRGLATRLVPIARRISPPTSALDRRRVPAPGLLDP